MTIRKRLFWSNILMIVVPVLAASLVGLLCLGVIWFIIVGGAGLDLQDPENFQQVSLAVTEMIEHQLEGDSDFSSLNALLDNNGMSAEVLQGEAVVYFFGDEEEIDSALKTAADALEGNALVSQNGRSLYKALETIEGTSYTVYLLGGSHSENAYANLKAALITSMVLIAFTIFLSILLTNRFLTRFVFRRIEEPLEILSGGVHELRDGNLSFRISYDRQDEFRPVCEDFNEMAERLRVSVDMLQRQERSRRELLAGISHDIRSPLTSIQAYVEGLLDGVARTLEARQRYLSTIKTKAEELDHLVSQLFLFSRLELGEAPENPVPLRLDAAVEKAVSEVREEYAAHGLTLETMLTPVTVEADPLQWERVLSNIMGNSLKYKEKEQGRLRIQLVKNNTECILLFDDDGPGVPAESLPHLFEVFYRSDPARRNPQKGSGLGLAIAKSVVTRVGGSIFAAESPLGGLRIEIHLPVKKEEGEPNGKNTDRRG